MHDPQNIPAQFSQKNQLVNNFHCDEKIKSACTEDKGDGRVPQCLTQGRGARVTNLI